MSSIMLSLLVLCIFVQSTQASSVHTHVEAVKRLTAAGIGIFSPGHCIDRSNKECVSLEGIHTEVIDGIIMLKDAAKCKELTVTGGTEVGHSVRPGSTKTHKDGWVIDIKKEGNSCPSEHIKTNFKQIGEKFWQDQFGNVYTEEANFWDIEYGNPKPAERSSFAK